DRVGGGKQRVPREDGRAAHGRQKEDRPKRGRCHLHRQCRRGRAVDFLQQRALARRDVEAGQPWVKIPRDPPGDKTVDRIRYLPDRSGCHSELREGTTAPCMNRWGQVRLRMGQETKGGAPWVFKHKPKKPPTRSGPLLG